MIFKYKNIIFQSNLLSGTYPNTNNLIPNDFNITVSIKLDDYFAAVDRAALLTQNKEKNIVKMRIKNNEMIINSFANEVGKVENRLTMDATPNANIDISFSAKYMMDALRTLDGENILILMNGDIKPIVLKSATDDSLIQLILPIKTY